MKTKLLLLLMLAFTLQAIGQIKFEKGYIVDNDGIKTECLIKNYDWNNNPSKIAYKIGETGEVLNGDFTNIKEFKVDGASRYVRVKTKIDQSTMDMAKLQRDRNPVWEEQTQFLKVLVEGKAVLYTYVSADLIRFFYSVSGSDVQQLVYKDWLFDKNGMGNDLKLATNNTYQQQLSVDVPLPQATSGSVTALSYNKSPLVKYFKKYNVAYAVAETPATPATEPLVSNDINLNSNTSKSERNYLNIKLAPGINSNNLVVDIRDKTATFYHADFGSFTTLRYGLETEFVMPFNKNKWSVTLEGNYQKSKVESINDKVYGYASLDYTSVDIAVGVRNYYFINSNFKFFIDASLIVPVADFNSKINLHIALKSDAITSSLVINAPITFAAGGGCEYKRLSFECRWYVPRNLIVDETGWEGKHSCLSFILGYKILQFKK